MDYVVKGFRPSNLKWNEWFLLVPAYLGCPE